jgi:hypothetical protein
MVGWDSPALCVCVCVCVAQANCVTHTCLLYCLLCSLCIYVSTNTTGMSCPPQAFIARDYLQRLAALLDPTRGVLAINVSARDPALLAVVGQNVADVFGSVFLYREPEETSEDVNVVLFALRPPGVVLPAVAVLAACLQAACAPAACDAEVLADLVERLDDLVPWSLSAAVVVAPESASSLPQQAAPTTTTGAKNKSKKKGKKKGRRN